MKTQTDKVYRSLKECLSDFDNILSKVDIHLCTNNELCVVTRDALLVVEAGFRSFGPKKRRTATSIKKLQQHVEPHLNSLWEQLAELRSPRESTMDAYADWIDAILDWFHRSDEQYFSWSRFMLGVDFSNGKDKSFVKSFVTAGGSHMKYPQQTIQLVSVPVTPPNVTIKFHPSSAP